MPELPEVETLRSQLSDVVVGKTIKVAKVKWPKMVSPLTPANFVKNISGSKILSIDRRAKMLVFKLKNKNTIQFLAVHLKMTGQLVFVPKSGQVTFGGHPQKGGLDDLPNKHTHIIIYFVDGSVLYFNDMRKFGWMRVVSEEHLEGVFKNYGLEALSPSFNVSSFKAMIDRFPNRKIKQILLDQSLIAGIGNIYADEACFATGLLPTRLAKDISDNELKTLLSHIKRILKLSISKKGTSYDTYVNLDGNRGGFVPYLKVYGRLSQPCKKCNHPIDKMRVVGRGTHYCPKCQK